MFGILYIGIEICMQTSFYLKSTVLFESCLKEDSWDPSVEGGVKNCPSLCCLSVRFYFDSESFEEKGSRQEIK
jgi:hypothetical protein